MTLTAVPVQSLDMSSVSSGPGILSKIRTLTRQLRLITQQLSKTYNPLNRACAYLMPQATQHSSQ
jgi:hypothetical protein